ncbi:MAG: hypothetical protein Q7S14_02050 [bacterium]|nr:hypothetical protein [bacterium]
MFIIAGEIPQNIEADYIVRRLEDKSEITIDQIHELQKQLSFKTSKFNVAIVEAQHLNISAQNALLKTLEEPPPNTTITLYVDNEDNLLPTIISRCVIKKQEISSKIQINPKLEDLDPEKIKDRQEAIQIIDSLMSSKDSIPIYRKLQKAKKYLQANCNIRLTLENLFLS